MRSYPFIRRIVILASLVLISWLPAMAAEAADKPSGGSPPVVLPGQPAIVTTGAVEDR